jgi:hypothetical protein
VRAGEPLAAREAEPAPEAANPQTKLGRKPKNQRLSEAILMHRNAKPKPKGWLLAVLDSIYKDGELQLQLHQEPGALR